MVSTRVPALAVLVSFLNRALSARDRVGLEFAYAEEAYAQVSKHRQQAGANWMAELPDDLLVKDMSIPGSHDTLTAYGYFSYSSTKGWPTKTICNDKHIPDLLEGGVRSLDFRFTQEHAVDWTPTAEEVDMSSLLNYFDDADSEHLLVLKDSVTLGEAFPSVQERFPSVAGVKGAMLYAVDKLRVSALKRLEDQKDDAVKHFAELPPAERLEKRLEFMFANNAEVPKVTFSLGRHYVTLGRHGGMLGTTFPIDLVAAMHAVRNFVKESGEFVIVFIKNEKKTDFSGFSYRAIQQLKLFDDVVYDWGDSKPSTNDAWAAMKLADLRGKVVIITSDEGDTYKSNAAKLGWTGKYLVKDAIYPGDIRHSSYKLATTPEKKSVVEQFLKQHNDLTSGAPQQAYGIALNLNPAAAKKKGGGLFGGFMSQIGNAVGGKELVVLADEMNAVFAKEIAPQGVVQKVGLTTFDFPLRGEGPALVNAIIALNQ